MTNKGCGITTKSPALEFFYGSCCGGDSSTKEGLEANRNADVELLKAIAAAIEKVLE